MRDFSKKTLNALAKKGISIMSITFVPYKGDYTRGERAYNVNDNGCGRVLTFLEVLEAAR